MPSSDPTIDLAYTGSITTILIKNPSDELLLDLNTYIEKQTAWI
ncbi:2106_t:CDS:2 [Funneliformis caledonium]|uniref:2106_t:CDS:1 n=1 Tax=Funneliformis caledonium TaxID=1117310 RepID=A0A9N9GMX7_9GLOM|nr:2106_t:CDS:2 [Funneliformis caledonium]